MNYTDIDWNKAWATETELWNQSAGKPCQGFWEDKQSAEVFAKKKILSSTETDWKRPWPI